MTFARDRWSLTAHGRYIPRALLDPTKIGAEQTGYDVNLPNSQSINPYSYIGNNPLSGTDPTGYSSVEEQPRDTRSFWLNDLTYSASIGDVTTSFAAQLYAGGGGGGTGGTPSGSPSVPPDQTNSAPQTGSKTETPTGNDSDLLAQATPPRGGGRGRGGGPRQPELPPESIEEIVPGANVRAAKERVAAAGGSTGEVTRPGIGLQSKFCRLLGRGGRCPGGVLSRFGYSTYHGCCIASVMSFSV